MIKVCTGGQGTVGCTYKLFPSQDIVVVGLVLLLCIIFIGWCFYDWFKHPENWEGSNTVEEAKIEDVKQ